MLLAVKLVAASEHIGAWTPGIAILLSWWPMTSTFITCSPRYRDLLSKPRLPLTGSLGFEGVGQLARRPPLVAARVVRDSMRAS